MLCHKAMSLPCIWGPNINSWPQIFGGSGGKDKKRHVCALTSPAYTSASCSCKMFLCPPCNRARVTSWWIQSWFYNPFWCLGWTYKVWQQQARTREMGKNHDCVMVLQIQRNFGG